MTFLMPSDRNFRRAERIKRGTARQDPDYDGFLQAFGTTFGVAPLTIGLDSLPRIGPRVRTPRLAVVMERTAEYVRFLDRRGNYDERKQRVIATMLCETVAESTLRTGFGMQRMLRRTPVPAGDVFVCFQDFERVAEQDVHDRTVDAERDAFVASLGIADEFWCIQRFSGPPVVFVHTDEQAKALEASALPITWADTYFELAKRHDEFGYLVRADITIQVDSKQNFDTNYSSNWYYYFK